MFSYLVVSNPRRAAGFSSIVANSGSLLVHGALIAAVVAVTTRPAALPAPRLVIPITWPDQPSPRRATTEHPVTVGTLGAAPGPSLVPPVVMPVGIPPVDLGAPIGRPSDRWRSMRVGVPGGDVFANGPATSALLTGDAVDEPPRLLNRPQVRYPSILLRAGIEGRVVMRFVVDTTGRPERASLEIVESSHAAFSAAARDVILRSRFRPARLGPTVVRVLVVQSVVFSIERREDAA